MSNVPILQLQNVGKTFGGLRAVDQLSLTVESGEIVGLIGPNGAGKTTVFNCVTQFYKDYDGDILFQNKEGQIVNLRDYKVTQVISQGLARTFQNVELVKDLSIIDNLLIGGHYEFTTGIVQHIFMTPKARREERQMRQKAETILESLGILHLKDFYVAGQPYGILKKIEIARTLMSDPKLIILDEPAAGLNDQETDELEQIIRQIKKDYNVTILLIEHDMGFVMNLCDRVCAINFGRFLAFDTPEMIQKNQAVIEAYLGGDNV
ncbi:ABC transporter ATP-binding protein [Candidatus Xianfuyuplasma coldseepsis]|uniref:ABC transporter ATP-binding protein n=1 Tax=Candidatus Xianfuyuplasma coldseepsis TaxID=2782163 RepID=A0A7L7KT47_9MOLU|nr:ABC transporter ATP-binding protein [Xianfuyuplasma coldseepsis]QMS85980.1 ABC transporter ATP-binding protein [Xianfuyuplasma coldseepsis]